MQVEIVHTSIFLLKARDSSVRNYYILWCAKAVANSDGRGRRHHGHREPGYTVTSDLVVDAGDEGVGWHVAQRPSLVPGLAEVHCHVAVELGVVDGRIAAVDLCTRKDNVVFAFS